MRTQSSCRQRRSTQCSCIDRDPIVQAHCTLHARVCVECDKCKQAAGCLWREIHKETKREKERPTLTQGPTWMLDMGGSRRHAGEEETCAKRMANVPVAEVVGALVS
jgi:hypothetical protein